MINEGLLKPDKNQTIYFSNSVVEFQKLNKSKKLLYETNCKNEIVN